MQKMCKISSTAARSECITVYVSVHCFEIIQRLRQTEMPLISLVVRCMGSCNQTNNSPNYLLLNEMRGVFSVSHSSAQQKKTYVPFHRRPSICVLKMQCVRTHIMFATYIALFIVTKSNSINTCQRYGVFELNKFILSFIRTFSLALSHSRHPARSHQRDTILYKRS